MSPVSVSSWWHEHIGRRGAALLFLGGTYILIALGYATSGFPIATYLPEFKEQPLSSLAVALWAGCGLIGILYAPRRGGADGAGFIALQVPAALWLVLQFATWVMSFDFAPWSDLIGNPRGWQGTLLYALISAAILLIAGWPEPRSDQRE